MTQRKLLAQLSLHDAARIRCPEAYATDMLEEMAVFCRVAFIDDL